MVVVLTLFIYSIILVVFLQRHNFAVGALIQVGSKFVSTPSTLDNVPVLINSDGYDGQFFYRLALDPFYKDLSISPRLDAPAYRQQRILYPLMVRAFSFGNKDSVPFVMVAINLLFLCFLAWLGAEYAMHRGRSPIWGLFLSLYPGFLFSLLRDLPESIAASFLLLCLFAIRVCRPFTACFALVLGILTRETVVLAAIAIFAVWLWHIWRKSLPLNKSKTEEGLRWYSGIVPLVVFVLWQGVIFSRWGRPSFAEAHVNIGVPLLGIVMKIRQLLPPFEKVLDIFDILPLVGYLLVGLLAGIELKSQSNLLHEKVTFLFYASFALLFTSAIWGYRGGFLRALSEFYLLGFLIIVPSTLQLSRFLFGYWILLFLGSAIGFTHSY